jgi:hypothetical protein
MIRRGGRHVAGSDHAPLIIGAARFNPEAIMLWDSNVQLAWALDRGTC